MVIDASALVAILVGESRAEPMARAIAQDPQRLVSAFSVIEAGAVLEGRKTQAAGRELDLLLHRIHADVVALSASQAELARVAWRRYGRRREPARLALGDCCVYALARESGEPLLTVSDALSQTDLRLVTF